MTEQERNLIRDAMMFAVKDITGRVMREATVQSMIDDFKKAINYTHSCSTLVCDNCETKLKAQYHTPKGIFCKKCKDLTN